MFTVYKITNLINNKHYIGVHKTDNPEDGYMGSGVAIKAAIKKYGKDNFQKDILLITEEKEQAYLFEREQTKDFRRNNTYNMKLGGVGGWSPDASRNGGRSVSLENKIKGGIASYQSGKGIHAYTSDEKKKCGTLGGLANKGKPKSEEQKRKISESLRGRKYKPRQSE